MVWRANALYELKRYDEAIKCYDKALEIDPNYNSLRYYKQNVLQKLGKDEDAKKCFDQQQQKGPDTTEKYESCKLDGRFLDEMINNLW